MISGKKLQKYRNDLGYTKEELAEKIGVPTRTIERWEDESTDIDPDSLINLSNVLNISINDLYLDKEEETKSKIYKIYQSFPYPILVVIIYLLIGFQFELWHPGWLLFLTIPLYYTVDCFFIKGAPKTKFVYPVFAALIYLFIGTVFNLWHPTWLIFLTIPVYYSIFN